MRLVMALVGLLSACGSSSPPPVQAVAHAQATDLLTTDTRVCCRMRANSGGRAYAWCAPTRQVAERSPQIETCDVTRPGELGTSAATGLVVYCLHRSDCPAGETCTLAPYEEGDFYRTRCESDAHLAAPAGDCVPEADYCKPPWCLHDAACVDALGVGARCLPLAARSALRVCQLP